MKDITLLDSKSKGNNSPKTQGPYGTIPIAIVKELYNRRNYSSLPFILYLDARKRCCEGKWEYNTADIANETGVDRRSINRIARLFHSAGILSAIGRTAKGARKYHLNQHKFTRFMEGKLVLEGSKMVSDECYAIRRHQQQENPIESGLSENGPVRGAKGWCRVNADLVSPDCSFGVQSGDTKISDKIEEEDKGTLKPLCPNKEVNRIIATKSEISDLVTKHFNAGKVGDGLLSNQNGFTPAPSSSCSIESPATYTSSTGSLVDLQAAQDQKEVR
jgi:hypothetical protein